MQPIPLEAQDLPKGPSFVSKARQKYQLEEIQSWEKEEWSKRKKDFPPK